MRNFQRQRGVKALLSSVLLILIWIWAFFQPQTTQAQWSSSSGVTSTTDTVGVGTTGPDRKVDILDSANPQLRLTFTDSSVFTDLQTLSSGQFIINPSGMDINGTKPFSVSASSDAFRFYTTADSNLRWAIGTDSTGLFNIAQRGNGWADQGTRFTINRSGNVGIGTTTPAGRFEIVNASGAFTASNYFQITGSTANNSNLPGISFKGGNIASIEYPFLQAANNGLGLTLAGARSSSGTTYSNRMQLYLSSNSNGGGYASFQLYNSTTGTKELLKVTENGNVGINVDPVSGYRLYVTEQAQNSYVASFRHNQWGTGSRGIYVETNGNNLADDVIGAYSGGGTTPVFVARANGNVGIGTSGPSQKLEVAGNIKMTGAGNGIVFPDGSVQTTAASGGTNSQWTTAGSNIYYSTGNVGVGTQSPGKALVVQNDTADNQLSIVRPTTNAATLNIGIDNTGSFLSSVTANKPISFYTNNGTNIAERLRVDNNGVTITGDISATGVINSRYQDVAEWVRSSQKLASGTVVILDPERTDQVIASSESYDTRVAGVVSEQPGVILGVGGEGKVKVATTGRVRVKVDATRGAIKIGDLLVTSDKEGMAMKSEPVNFNGRLIHSPGTIIGKALEPLEIGTGEILVLLSLQ